jgi:Bax protein
MTDPETPTSSRRRGALIAGSVAFVVLVAGGVWFAQQPPGANARSGPVPDFAAIEDVQTKKDTFFGFLAPMIAERNEWVLKQRAFLRNLRDRLDAGGSLPADDVRRVEQLAERYRVDTAEGIDVTVIDTLLHHCDVVPPSLALAQAASESGWGTSRFAREGNNYFGEWCFSEGCGLIPGRRGAEQTHEVEVFPTVEAAVDSYFRNLNRVAVYEPLRETRARARAAGRPITGEALAAGLERYSERGTVYIEEVRSIISYNDLERYDASQLAGTPAGAPAG